MICMGGEEEKRREVSVQWLHIDLTCAAVPLLLPWFTHHAFLFVVPKLPPLSHRKIDIGALKVAGKAEGQRPNEGHAC